MTISTTAIGRKIDVAIGGRSDTAGDMTEDSLMA